MQSALDIGIDVGHAHVVVACANGSWKPHKLVNSLSALEPWARGLPAGSRLGVEATGRYHDPVVSAATKAGLSVYVLNPRDVKRYAAGVGARGKTDRVDAEVIARFVAREHDHCHPYRAPSPAEGTLTALLKRRRKLVALRESTRQTCQAMAGAQAQLERLLDGYAQMLSEIDRLIAAAMCALPRTAARQARLRRVPGFGPLGSTAVAHALGHYEFRCADAFIAYTGLDPRPDDSGTRRGRRRLSKRGPAELRHVLHMCAMAAAKTSAWRPYYQAQRAKGLSGTAALVVLARKMARTAYALCKTEAAFDARRISGHG